LCVCVWGLCVVCVCVCGLVCVMFGVVCVCVCVCVCCVFVSWVLSVVCLVCSVVCVCVVCVCLSMCGVSVYYVLWVWCVFVCVCVCVCEIRNISTGLCKNPHKQFFTQHKSQFPIIWRRFGPAVRQTNKWMNEERLWASMQCPPICLVFKNNQ